MAKTQVTAETARPVAQVELGTPVSPIAPAAVNVWRASLRAIYILWYRDVVRFWRDRCDRQIARRVVFDFIA